MLSLEIKKLLLRSIPSTITVDGHQFAINRTIGSTPLNTLTLPTINLKFIGEGTPYYRSFDDEHIMNDTVNTYKNTYVCTLRYTIAATDTVISTTQSIKYLDGVNTYPIERVPVLDITNITGYEKNIDYRLNASHESITWIGDTPAVNANFTVEYDWIDSGLYIVSQFTEYLMKDVQGRVFDLLKPYGINMIGSKGGQDLSDIITNDALNAFSFDITITYPFTWTTTITTEDASIAESIDLNLYINEINAGTISTTNNEE